MILERRNFAAFQFAIFPLF